MHQEVHFILAEFVNRICLALVIFRDFSERMIARVAVTFLALHSPTLVGRLLALRGHNASRKLFEELMQKTVDCEIDEFVAANVICCAAQVNHAEKQAV